MRFCGINKRKERRKKIGDCHRVSQQFARITRPDEEVFPDPASFNSAQLGGFDMAECPICSGEAQRLPVDYADMQYRFSCQLCGKFRITHELIVHGINTYAEPYIVSGLVRNFTEAGQEICLTTENIEDYVSSIPLPETPFEAIDLLLEFIFQKANRPGETIDLLSYNWFPIVYARDRKEFSFYLTKACELKYIEQQKPPEDHFYALALEGWRRLSSIREHKRKPDQAFVAMWFAKSMDSAWENGFQKALIDTGYKNALRIDLSEHNEKICDRILAEIRKSSLVVADFTGQRSGVFFEAGFALGLGVPVIWCCRDTDVKKLKNHFDTRQYNHIVWSAPDDLRMKLKNRIEATIPNGRK
jgi:hypothetical protein